MKEKIKLKAIELFNKFGVSTVSMLQIADSLSISAGNLSYHYKNKAVLLHSIYNDIHKKSINYIKPLHSHIAIDYYELVLMKFNQVQNEYTFFFNELVHIARVYPDIIKKYEQTNIKRFKESRKIINYYIQAGYIAKEEGWVDYNKLIYSIFMTSTFWQSQSQVINDENFQTNKCHPMEMLWNLLIPYLTTQGLQEYKEIKNHIKTIN